MSRKARVGAAVGGLAIIAAAIAVIVVRFRPATPPVPQWIRFTDVTDDCGISFTHTHGGSGRRYIMETVTAGLALFDYDRDGDVDIYFLNGTPLRGTPPVDPPPRNALYRNDGDWVFTDVTEEAGVGDTGYGLGVAAGDFDNDGDLDLYLNNFGPNVFCRNEGDGTFTDVTAESGAGDDGVGAGVAFLDIENDGDLDLFVSRYLVFEYEKHSPCIRNGVPIYCDPGVWPPISNRLFRNEGDGTFMDVSGEAGIAGHESWGMGIVCADIENDGDADIFIANDVAENFLFVNDGRGRFEEKALDAGTAYDEHGDEQGSMGVDAGDYDGDGLIDFYQTSYQNQLALLFRNLGGGRFRDVTGATGSGAGTLAKVTWGNHFIDADNDGVRDLFVACGHLQDTVEQFDGSTTYKETNILFRHDGKGHFRDVSAESGDGLAACEVSRGAGFDDLDGDGDVDIAILNVNARPTILRNDGGERNHWLQVVLVGRRANRDGVGAHVLVTAGGRTQVDEVHAGRGYQSDYGKRLTFGFGSASRAERIEVRWPGGAVSERFDVPADRFVLIVEGAPPVQE